MNSRLWAGLGAGEGCGTGGLLSITTDGRDGKLSVLELAEHFYC